MEILRTIPLFLFLVFSLPLIAGGFQWPIPEKHAHIISSTFGESRLDHFHAGVDIPGKGVPVLPMKEGAVVYALEGKLRPNELPFGGGKTIVMEHSDLSWTVYMHLDTINAQLYTQKDISREQTIGHSGDSGHSGGAHLHFGLYYPQENRIANPLKYLPQKEIFYVNNVSPSIKQFGVLVEDRFAIIRDIEKPLTMTKDYNMYAAIEDSGNGKERWGVYSLKAYKDNDKKPVISWDMESIYFKNQKWLTRNGLEFHRVFYDRFYNLGNHFRNATNITIEATGLNGVPIRKEYTLNIIKNK